MKRFFSLLIGSTLLAANAWGAVVSGPDGRLQVTVDINDSKPYYSVQYDGKTLLEPSPLGFWANIGDYTTAQAILSGPVVPLTVHYTADRIKRSRIDHEARELRCSFTTREGRHFDVVFRVSNNDLAFRYEIPREGENGGIYIRGEATGFALPSHALSFVCPQSEAMAGWKRTKPSYEEEYRVDVPVTEPSAFGNGFTFPCLFRVGDDGWVLLGETGVDGHYCASHLSDYTDGAFRIAFPMDAENDGVGPTGAAFALPGKTPWRTVTVGQSLKPIVETTVTWDVVEPLYETRQDYVFAPGTWSWILWDDKSINLRDQKKYVDLAAAMGYKYTLVDNFWDREIGREHLPELAEYARERGVSLLMWYSSSGYWNDIAQSPLNCMDDPIVRKREMRWLASIGVKGIKVDFFGGDKQETMRLYEAILSDADDAGLAVIFHGCTLPRGWERMYPNYVGSEAVLASENLRFSEHFCQMEAFNACLHPFIRNSLGCMEFGGCFLNKYYRRDNRSGHPRHTSDVFQLATTVLFQNPIQNFALAPNNLDDAPEVCLEFLRTVPTTWDDTVFIDGYPGRYVVLARRKDDTWYVAGANATGKALALDLDLPMLHKGDTYTLFVDKDVPERVTRTGKSSRLKVSLPADGGFVLVR